LKLPRPSTTLSTLALLVSNLVAAAFAWLDGWDLAELMPLYWFQSAVIGAFNFLRILSFRRFDPTGLRINRQPIDDSKNSQFKVAFFFLFHYGMFHFGYYAFIAEKFPNASILPVAAVISAASFLLHHSLAFWQQHKADLHSRPDIGTAMFFPYARILPMHLTPFIG